jgi:hypothetical protein
MTPAEALVVVLAVLATVVTLMWFVLGRHHPENAAGHTTASGGWPERPRTLAHQGDVFDRPAGPGAEADGVAGRGQPVPGPSADALPQPGYDDRASDRPPLRTEPERDRGRRADVGRRSDQRDRRDLR